MTAKSVKLLPSLSHRLDGRHQCVPAFFVSVRSTAGGGACYDPGACYDGGTGSRHCRLCAGEILHGCPDPCGRRHCIQQAVCPESGCRTAAFQMPKGGALIIFTHCNICILFKKLYSFIIQIFERLSVTQYHSTAFGVFKSAVYCLKGCL